METICSYVGLGCSCVEGGRYFWHLLSGLLILVVVVLPLGCCEFVRVGLPHLFLWSWSSIVLLFVLVTSVSMLQFWCEWVSFCCCTL